jgi:hypothetical protein
MVEVSEVCRHNHHLQLGSATNLVVASFVVTGHRQAGRSSDPLQAGSEDESTGQEPDEELAAAEAEEHAAAVASREALQWLGGDNPRRCLCAGCTPALSPSAGIISGFLTAYTMSHSTAYHQCSGQSLIVTAVQHVNSAHGFLHVCEPPVSRDRT